MTERGSQDENRPKPNIAILHYSAAPVVGGVEAVISAHAGLFMDNGYPVTVVAGNARADSLPEGTGFIRIPEMDTRHPQIVSLNPDLENGRQPSEFAGLVDRLADDLRPRLTGFDNLIVHNIFSKHFNLPLTAALARLLDEGVGGNWIAWCHDLTWTSPNSRHKVHPGYPWDLLRRPHPRLCYVTISKERQTELAGLFELPAEEVRVIYNGVDPAGLLGLTETGIELAERLGWMDSDLNLLMPVRVTQAKNVEYAIEVTAAIKKLGLRLKLALTGPPDPHEAGSMAYFSSLQALRRKADVEQELRFVFESGPDPETPYTIPLTVVGDLFRLADLIFMPSRREGFGMPVLEAGLTGVPFASTSIPAAVEIGGNDVFLFNQEDDPTQTAGGILAWLNANPASRLKRKVRREYTWQAIFRREIEPLLFKGIGDAN
jgi:mannosylglucosylglycerate synthase